MLRGKSPEISTLSLLQALLRRCSLIPFETGVPEPTLDAFYRLLELPARRPRLVVQHDGATSIVNPPAFLSSFDGARKMTISHTFRGIHLDANFAKTVNQTILLDF